MVPALPNSPRRGEVLPHLGRHPNEYHQFVIENTKKAAREAGRSKAKFFELYQKYVKTPVRNNPEMLNKSYWQ